VTGLLVADAKEHLYCCGYRCCLLSRVVTGLLVAEAKEHLYCCGYSCCLLSRVVTGLLVAEAKGYLYCCGYRCCLLSSDKQGSGGGLRMAPHCSARDTHLVFQSSFSGIIKHRLLNVSHLLVVPNNLSTFDMSFLC
jgi:hypothetical protein